MPFNLHDLALSLPETFLTLSICAVLAIDLVVKPWQRDAIHWVSIGALVATLVLVLVFPEPDTRAFSGMYVHDGVATLLKVFILLVVGAGLMYARTYLRERNLYVGEFYMLVLFGTLGMLLLVSAGDLVMVYLGLELLTLSSYALVGLNRDSGLSSEAAMKYFVLGALASGILLYGMSMIYGATGTLDLDKIGAMTALGANGNFGPHSALLAFGLVFVIAGIGFKFGAAPFHMWLPDVYQGSPTAVTVFIGAAPKIAAFGLAYRLLEGALGTLYPHWHEMLAVLAVLSLAIGNVVAIAQTNLKRMLAYSTISHVGFLLLGFANGKPSGYAAAAFYAISYAIMSSAAFGAILLLARAGFEAEEIDDFKGLNQRNPWYALVVLMVMASLAGIPPFFGFFAKLFVLQAAIDAGMLWLAIVAVVFAIVGAYYYLRVIKVMYFDPPATKGPLPLPHDLPLRWTLSINGAALLFLGLFFGPLLSWCYRAFGVN